VTYVPRLHVAGGVSVATMEMPMPHSEHDVGFLTGKMQAMETDIRDIKADQRRMWERLDSMSGTLARIEGRQTAQTQELEEIGDTIKQSSTRSLPVVDASPWYAKLLLSPAAAFAVSALICLAALLICVSAISGRNAKDLIALPHAVAPVIPGDMP
jgi:hypothetical protein